MRTYLTLRFRSRVSYWNILLVRAWFQMYCLFFVFFLFCFSLNSITRFGPSSAAVRKMNFRAEHVTQKWQVRGRVRVATNASMQTH